MSDAREFIGVGELPLTVKEATVIVKLHANTEPLTPAETAIWDRMVTAAKRRIAAYGGAVYNAPTEAGGSQEDA